jgi:hypothetical protein
VQGLEAGDRIEVTYAHKSRHYKDEYDETTTVDVWVTEAVTTTDDDGAPARIRLQTNATAPDADYDGSTRYVRADGDTVPVFLHKSTGPSRKHNTQLGRVDDIDIVDDGTDDADNADMPSPGDTFVGVHNDKVYTVETVDDASFDTVVRYDNGSADTIDDFVESVESGVFVPVADTATETCRRVLSARDEDADPFEVAVDKPMNDADRHKIRFVADRSGDRTTFDFGTGLAGWFEPDKIVAEQYGVVDEVQSALSTLTDAVDLRTVKGGARYGHFAVDPADERVVGVQLHELSMSFTGDDTAVDAGDAMLRHFDGVDAVQESDDRHLTVERADPVTDGGHDADDDPDDASDASDDDCDAFDGRFEAGDSIVVTGKDCNHDDTVVAGTVTKVSDGVVRFTATDDDRWYVQESSGEVYNDDRPGAVAYETAESYDSHVTAGTSGSGLQSLGTYQEVPFDAGDIAIGDRVFVAYDSNRSSSTLTKSGTVTNVTYNHAHGELHRIVFETDDHDGSFRFGNDKFTTGQIHSVSSAGNHTYIGDIEFVAFEAGDDRDFAVPEIRSSDAVVDELTDAGVDFDDPKYNYDHDITAGDTVFVPDEHSGTFVDGGQATVDEVDGSQLTATTTRDGDGHVAYDGTSIVVSARHVDRVDDGDETTDDTDDDPDGTSDASDDDCDAGDGRIRTDGGQDTDDDTEVDAHDLERGDNVVVQAEPIAGDDGKGRIAGTVTDTDIKTVDGTELSNIVKLADADGKQLVWNAGGRLSVVDTDGWLAVISFDATLHAVRTDGGQGAGDDGDDGDFDTVVDPAATPYVSVDIPVNEDTTVTVESGDAYHLRTVAGTVTAEFRRHARSTTDHKYGTKTAHTASFRWLRDDCMVSVEWTETRVGTTGDTDDRQVNAYRPQLHGADFDEPRTITRIEAVTVEDAVDPDD